MDCRAFIEHLRYAEIEQLWKQSPGALYHHHIPWLQISVDNSLLMCRLDHLTDLLQKRDKLLQREWPICLQQLIQRRSMDDFHSDPQQPIRLCAECIDVCRVWMLET